MSKNKEDEAHPVGGSDTWCSPLEINYGLRELFGAPVHTDPCTNDRSVIEAIVKYTRGGLVYPWMKTAYENPPFSMTDAFTTKALHEITVGHCTELVRLTMVAPSTKWWVRMAKFRRNPRFLFTKRLKFRGDTQSAKGKAKNEGARFDTVLTYFGSRPQKFDKAFSHLQRWSTWGR